MNPKQELLDALRAEQQRRAGERQKLIDQAAHADAEIGRLEDRRLQLLVPAMRDNDADAHRELEAIPALKVTLEQRVRDCRDAATALEARISELSPEISTLTAEVAASRYAVAYARHIVETDAFQRTIDAIRDALPSYVLSAETFEREYQAFHGRPSGLEPVELRIAKALKTRAVEWFGQYGWTLDKRFPAQVGSLVAPIQRFAPEPVTARTSEAGPAATQG